MSELATAIRQIQTARDYSNDLLDNVPDEAWFQMPDGHVSHIAWQAGHLAVCEYGLALKRIRGSQPGDDELVNADAFQLFGKGSVPVADATTYPTVAEIRALMSRVHEQVISELESLDESVLSESSTDPPHRMFSTKGGSLTWCAQHEFLHAGQIGLLRRQAGEKWLR